MATTILPPSCPVLPCAFSQSCLNNIPQQQQQQQHGKDSLSSLCTDYTTIHYPTLPNLDSRESLYRTKSPFLQHCHFSIRQPKIYPWALTVTVAGHLLALPTRESLLSPAAGFSAELSDLDTFTSILLLAKEKTTSCGSIGRLTEDWLSLRSKYFCFPKGFNQAIWREHRVPTHTQADVLITAGLTPQGARLDIYLQRHSQFFSTLVHFMRL